MKPLPLTPELLKLAPYIIWFEPAEQALASPIRFMAYVMTYGTFEEINIVKTYINDDDFKEALTNAPPGIFDKRSWNYWNLILDFEPALEMPKRRFE